ANVAAAPHFQFRRQLRALGAAMNVAGGSGCLTGTGFISDLLTDFLHSLRESGMVDHLRPGIRMQAVGDKVTTVSNDQNRRQGVHRSQALSVKRGGFTGEWRLAGGD